MFPNLTKVLSREISGERALSFVREIALFHRIQASPGYRKAAERVRDILKDYGLNVFLHSFPLRKGEKYFSHPSFEAWDPREGELYVEKEGEWHKLADFREEPIALIPRSKGFIGETEVVLLEDGEEESDYKGKDIKGRMVLTRGDLRRVQELAVERYGAIGIIRDGIADPSGLRQGFDLPDARQYVSFWWFHEEKKAFGFSITPRQGETLRSILQEGKKTLRARVKVAASFYPGSLEVVEASIPGEIPELPEILLLAHLCHPKPSANDNASGAAALLETAIVLKRLKEEGKISLRRGVRFLWVPEMAGTMAYLARKAKDRRFVAGLNLDMVGERQESTGSTLLLIGTPDSAPGFTDSLLYQLARTVFKEGKGFEGRGAYPLFRIRESPFMGGSDHFILSDPSIGIPTPMLNQWPDRYYHTSEDTPDKTDPRMLERVTLLSSLYAIMISEAEEREIRWMGLLLLQTLKKRLDDLIEDSINPLSGVQEESLGPFPDIVSYLHAKSQHLFQRFRKELLSLSRLGEETHEEYLKEAKRALRIFRDNISSVIGRKVRKGPEHLDKASERAREILILRKFKGPVSPFAFLSTLSWEDREKWYEINKKAGMKARILPPLTLFWSDGKRTLFESSLEAFLETGLWDPDYLARYFSLLQKMDLVSLQEVKASRG